MEIKKAGDKIIVEIPFWQEGNYTYGDGKWKVNNLFGIIAGDEMTISKAIYLDYKDDIQEGMPLVHFYGEEEEFIKLCETLGISYIKHEVCKKCRKPIYGTATWDAGWICGECEFKKSGA